MTNNSNEETKFNKYKLEGPDYHYRQIQTRNPAIFNAYLYARYHIGLALVNKALKEIGKDSYKILDVGCGDAVLLYYINQRNRNYNLQLFGIDNSKDALYIAKEKNPNGTFKIADIYELPFEDNYFDLIISTDVIEHITNPMKMLSEIKRVGKKDSMILIGTPIRYREKPMAKTHYHEFFPEEFKTLLNEFFTEIQLTQCLNLKYLLLSWTPISIFGKNIFFYRYFINLLSLYFNRNPFLKKRTSKIDIYSYMLGMGKIKK